MEGGQCEGGGDGHVHSKGTGGDQVSDHQGQRLPCVSPPPPETF